MKRTLAIVTAALVAATSLSAQAWGPRAVAPAAPAAAAETVKVEGKLALVNGMIAVTEKDKTYYVGGLNRLIGFIDGLKEGASVKVEGYAIAVPAAPEYLHLRATKLAFAGKDYDLSQGMGGRMGGGMMGGFGGGPQGGMMGGRGGDNRGNYGPQQGMGGRGRR